MYVSTKNNPSCPSNDTTWLNNLDGCALFDDPFVKRPLSSTDRMLSMFWTRHPDAVRQLFELTKENRQKDAWLSCFLKGARHGNQGHELYCFMHGLPTKHAGSWMPSTDNALRGKAERKALPAKWTRELLEESRRSWDARRSEECSICDDHRQRRCRVLYRGEKEKMQHAKFLDAPLIHPYNAPKYHASLIRAQQYAFRTGRILLWAAAEDQPCHPDHTGLSQEDLETKRAEWSMFHDQKTGGVMGLQPLAINMPLRITQTDQSNKTTLFKNRRCKLRRVEVTRSGSSTPG